MMRVIHQSAATECGLACLGGVLSYHGQPSDLA
jgi:ABC-type bacteriocin/lantibiotic exporter with double-glycine peptidase domain